MSKTEILVAYSSGYGATKEIAEEIVRILSGDNAFSVEIQNIDECNAIEKYDAVVVGSSVRADRALANVRDFFAEHRYELAKKRVALFVVSITAAAPGGEDVAKKEQALQLLERYPLISALSIAAFGGKVDFEKLNPVMQSLVHCVMREKGMDGNGSFDARNWEAIRTWAKQLAFKLKDHA